MFTGGLVTPFSGDPWGCKADVHRLSGLALDVAADPVTAVPSPVREILAADSLGVGRERFREAGGVHVGPSVCDVERARRQGRQVASEGGRTGSWRLEGCAGAGGEGPAERAETSP